MAEEKWEDLFPEATKQKQEQFVQGVNFAQRYLVFAGPTADKRAVELLAQWTQMVRRKVVALDATPQEYAAHNAVREFVEALHAQIEHAQQNASVVTTRNLP